MNGTITVIHLTSANGFDVRFGRYAENVGIQVFRVSRNSEFPVCSAIGGRELAAVAHGELVRPQVMAAVEDMAARQASGVLAVTGSPSGAFYLDGGRIAFARNSVAVELHGGRR